MANPRISLALARDGLLPRKLAAVNSGGTPYFGLLLTTVASVVLAAIGSFEMLNAIAQFFAVTLSILTLLAFFVLRGREPDAPRPYRAWLYPVAPGIVLVFSILIFVAYAFGNPFPSVCAIAVLFVSYPVFRLMNRKDGNAD